MARSSPPIKPHSSNSKALQKNYAPQKPKCKSWNYVHFHDFLIDINVTLPSRHLQTYEMISAAVCNFFSIEPTYLLQSFVSIAYQQPQWCLIHLNITCCQTNCRCCSIRAMAWVKSGNILARRGNSAIVKSSRVNPFLCVTQSIQISIPYGGLPRKTDKSIIRSLRAQLKILQIHWVFWELTI